MYTQIYSGIGIEESPCEGGYSEELVSKKKRGKTDNPKGIGGMTGNKPVFSSFITIYQPYQWSDYRILSGPETGYPGFDNRRSDCVA